MYDTHGFVVTEDKKWPSVEAIRKGHSRLILIEFISLDQRNAFITLFDKVSLTTLWTSLRNVCWRIITWVKS